MARSKEELMKLGIFDLRKIGMDVGVKLPTTYNKAELIEEIILIETNQKEPYVKSSKRGRPSKFVTENGRLTSNSGLKRFDYSSAFGLESCCKNFSPGVNTNTVVGIIDLSTNNEYVLVPLVTYKKYYYIHDSIISRYKLKCGDVIKCKVSCNLDDNYVVEVDKINNKPVYDFQRVINEEDVEQKKELVFDNDTLTSKLFPMYQGDRVILSCLEKKELLINTFKLTKNIALNNDVSIYVLLNNTNKKCISVFEQLENVYVFATLFGDSIESQSNLIRLYHNSVKNACETKDNNVVMIIEDIGELYKFYLEENEEKVVLEKMKNNFIQANKYKDSSLTIIFGSQREEVFYDEFEYASSVNLVPLEMSDQDISMIKYNLLESSRNELLFALENKLDNVVKRFCKGSNYMEKHKKLEQIAQNSSTEEEIYQKLLEIL